MKKMTAREKRMKQLLYTLVDGTPVTYEDMGWSQGMMYQAVQDLRDLFKRDGDSTVVCEPVGGRQPWQYKLIHGSVVTDEDTSKWLPHNIASTKRRLDTLDAVVTVAERVTDGRTTAGRNTRIIGQRIKSARQQIDSLTAA